MTHSPSSQEMTKGGSMPGEPARQAILGVPIALCDYETTIRHIAELSQLPRPSAVSFCNTHLVAEAARQPAFLRILQGFDLNLPDGMPLVWCLNAGGAALRDRVYGPYLMQKFFSGARSTPPLRHFLFGGTEQTLASLQLHLASSDSATVVVGTFSPPFRVFTEADQSHFAEVIRDAAPDCIWVALGGVRQETWIAQNLHRFERGVFLAVGDAFSLLAGQSSFAPAWMQRHGLTWLHRLIHDPVRLGRRYLRFNLLFLFYIVREQMSRLRSV